MGRVERSPCCHGVGLSTLTPSGLDILTAAAKNTSLDVGLNKRFQNHWGIITWECFSS